MYDLYLSDLWTMSQWGWQWMVTLTFKGLVSREEALGRAFEWIRDLQTSEGIQVGAYYAFSRRGNRWHFHFLMIGYGRREGRRVTLNDISRKKWSKRWGRSPAAKIEIPKSTLGVTKYVAMHNLEKKSDEVWTYPYNERLLRKHKTRRPVRLEIRSNRPGSSGRSEMKSLAPRCKGRPIHDQGTRKPRRTKPLSKVRQPTLPGWPL